MRVSFSSPSDSVPPAVDNAVEQISEPANSPANVISTDPNMAVNPVNQDNENVADTSSKPQKSNEIKDESTPSGVSLSEENVQVDAIKSDESSEHQNPDKVEEENVGKIDHPVSSPEHEQEDDETSASHQSKTNSNLERFETADISSVRYEDIDEPDLLEFVLENASDKRLIDRLLGCAYGQALGDAYGLSTEFEDRERVAYKYPTASLIPFPNYVLTGHNRRWTRGDWTDDTDQWILILLTLMFHNGDERVFAQKLRDWIYNGYPELGDHGGLGLGANVSQVMS